MELDKLIKGETYYANFGSHGVQKLKLIKIIDEQLDNNIVKITVRSFPKKANEEHFDSWQLWSDEIFGTRKEAIKSKV